MSENNETVKTTSQAVPKSGPRMLPLIVVAIVIMAAVGGIFMFNKFMKPDIDPDEVNVSISINYGNGTVEWYNVSTVNNSMTGVLSQAIDDNNFVVEQSIEGVLYIESLRGVRNNGTVNGLADTEDRWWRYSINGTLAPLTNQTFDSRNTLAPIKNGQTIAFAFMKSDGPSGIVDKSGISITVRIDYGNGTVAEEIVTTSNYTALGALEAMVGHGNLDMTDHGGLGILVNGINGVSTGSTVEGIEDTSNYYWFWYVNDDFAYVGASQYVLQDGDVMEWRFEESSW
ncbi:MAG: DUF4430 domain-containing protein [Thermoplasmata archaeon]|nr:DUF4430 domain-containing protein [Thermoplasmata archaeon]